MCLSPRRRPVAPAPRHKAPGHNGQGLSVSRPFPPVPARSLAPLGRPRAARPSPRRSAVPAPHAAVPGPLSALSSALRRITARSGAVTASSARPGGRAAMITKDPHRIGGEILRDHAPPRITARSGLGRHPRAPVPTSAPRPPPARLSPPARAPSPPPRAPPPCAPGCHPRAPEPPPRPPATKGARTHPDKPPDSAGYALTVAAAVPVAARRARVSHRIRTVSNAALSTVNAPAVIQADPASGSAAPSMITAT